MKKPSKMQKRFGGITYKQLGIGSTAIVKTKTKEEVAEEQAAWDAPQRVIFMSRNAAKSFDFNAATDVLISISDTGVSAPSLSKAPKDMLWIDFHDHVERGGEELGHHWITHEQAKEIAQFVIKHTDIRNLMIHCNYGESRSKAVAMAIKHHTLRSLLRSNDYGTVALYKANEDVGNRRVYTLVADMLLRYSEEAA